MNVFIHYSVFQEFAIHANNLFKIKSIEFLAERKVKVKKHHDDENSMLESYKTYSIFANNL